MCICGVYGHALAVDLAELGLSLDSTLKVFCNTNHSMIVYNLFHKNFYMFFQCTLPRPPSPNITWLLGIVLTFLPTGLTSVPTCSHYYNTYFVIQSTILLEIKKVRKVLKG